MDEQINRLVEKTWDKFQKLQPTERYLVSVSGIPGSGKTTLAAYVAKRLNAKQAALYGKTTAPPIAAFVPMDGYHLSRAQLSAMPNPQHARDRRGAEFTFDGESFLKLVKAIREPLTSDSRTLYAPSFDHAVKDPKADDIPIEPTTRILIFEGLYLSLDKEPWKSAAKLMDERWFIEVDFETAKNRLIPRHIKAGIAENEEAAEKRARENDLVNGEQIVNGRLAVHEIITSKEDESWGPEAQESTNAAL
ncbi:P-loop containing nucleoside triphosphate hydrolase protein [Xylogone sp. PMI_703]|nr:P-loop containing nucleoside triphosphate hydrolase protein [Xylogone sp. PMI_703]